MRAFYLAKFSIINIFHLFITIHTQMQNFSIRKANADDAYWISYVNAHTRYSTYKWLIPEKMLETRINTIDERTEKTREFIANGKNYLVIENNETHEIVWMSIYWPSRNEKYPNSGEIYAIYILKEYQKNLTWKKIIYSMNQRIDKTLI